jgi:hypothetical protein
MSIEA